MSSVANGTLLETRNRVSIAISKERRPVSVAVIGYYPRLRDVQLTVQHRGDAFAAGADRKVTYGRDLPSVIPCSNHECRYLYRMPTLLSWLAAHGLEACIGELKCNGCSNSVNFSLRLRYHERAADVTYFAYWSKRLQGKSAGLRN